MASWKCDLNWSYILPSQSYVVCVHAYTCARRVIYWVVEYTYLSHTLARRIGYLCWFQSSHVNWCMLRKVYMGIIIQLLGQFVKQNKKLFFFPFSLFNLLIWGLLWRKEKYLFQHIQPYKHTGNSNRSTVSMLYFYILHSPYSTDLQSISAH